MAYKPRPIDTSQVALTPDIVDLTERLAENAHELWAIKRMAEGWTYGPEKRGDIQQTPLLVPYAELSEAEKQYDRDLAMETLKVVLALGYSLIPPNNAPEK
jgi:hypothetical protein